MANISHTFVVNKIIPFFRVRRWQLFNEWHAPRRGETILDLGGGDGSSLASLYPFPENIVLADIDKDQIEFGVKKYGLKGALLLDEDGGIPLESNSVDVVFCNSVIEHVTVPKEHVWKENHGNRFNRIALKRQTRMANEIMRVAEKYWVQTPYRHFPLETHTWLLGIQYMPRVLQMKIIRLFNRFWIKKTSPDYYLLSKAEAYSLFPNSEIIFERIFGVPKSLIIRTPKS